MTDGQTDRRTDGQTDGQTDGFAIAYSALSMLSRANKITKMKVKQSGSELPKFQALVGAAVADLIHLGSFHYVHNLGNLTTNIIIQFKVLDTQVCPTAKFQLAHINGHLTGFIRY